MSDNPLNTSNRCPYLGKVDDRESFYNQATRRHRCYRWDRPLPVRRQDQDEYCLSPLHGNCPRHTDPNALPVPENHQKRRHKHSLRILGIPIRRLIAYSVPLVLLLVLAVAASIALAKRTTSSPLAMVTVLAKTSTAVALATNTPTRFPTWTVSPGGSSTAVVVLPTQTAILMNNTPTVIAPVKTSQPGPTTIIIRPTTPLPTRSTGNNTTGSPFGSPLTSPIWPTLTTATAIATPSRNNATPTSTPTVHSVSTTTRAVATATPRPTSTAVPTATPTAAPYNYMVLGSPQKTLLPSGIDVCSRVHGRVFDRNGSIITKQVALAVQWWPNNELVVGAPGWPAINDDGYYEFCLSRGQFTITVLDYKKTSEKYWFDTDEENFKGQLILEINFLLTR